MSSFLDVDTSCWLGQRHLIPAFEIGSGNQCELAIVKQGFRINIR